MSDINANVSLLIKNLRDLIQDSLNVSENETIRNEGNLLVPLHELWSFAAIYNLLVPLHELWSFAATYNLLVPLHELSSFAATYNFPSSPFLILGF